MINKGCEEAKYPHIVITMESFIEFKVEYRGKSVIFAECDI